MELWGWILAIAGGISAIGGAAAVIAKWITPVVSVSDRLKAVEQHDARDMVRFDGIDAQQKKMHAEIMDELREQRSAIITLIMHNMYGNHEAELREKLNQMQNN